jgi:hypothetical protein
MLLAMPVLTRRPLVLALLWLSHRLTPHAWVPLLLLLLVQEAT